MTFNADHTPEASPEALDNSNTLSFQNLQDTIALELVNRTFDRYSLYRQNNHDARWNANDALYYGYVPQRFWEGTNVPRSSLGIPIVFDQVESALPAIVNALFQGSTEYFQVEALPGTSPQEAIALRDHLMYLLEHPRDKMGHTARTEIILAIKDLLIHGNGVLMLEVDPVTGDPVVHWVDIRDIYVDPGCGSILDESKAIILRKFLTVEQLDSLRSHPDFRIPSLDTLKQFAQQRLFDAADHTKQTAEALRGVNFRPGADDKSDLPADQTVEVLIYFSQTRIIWVINRQLVAYNSGNPYGFYTFAGSPCFIIPGRWYAMGFADVLEGIQKYMQGITNGRLDELNIALNPPRARKRGAVLTPSQSRWRPGLIMELDNPKEDMVVHPPQNVTQAAWQEMAYLESQAQQRTGMNSLMTSGTPMKSNASRTSLGIQVQLESPSSRLQKIVETIEDYMIVPLLYKLQAMSEKHKTGDTVNALKFETPAPPAPGQPGQFGPGPMQGPPQQGPQGPPQPPQQPQPQYYQVPASVVGKPVKFRMLGATRMLTRQKLAQIFPFVAQYMVSGPFMQQLAAVGQTVDFMELTRMLQDATGTRQAYQLIRPLTPQEQQARNQPSPDAQMKMQAAQLQAQTRTQVAQTKMAQDQMRMFMDYAVKNKQIDESTATAVLKLLKEALDGGNHPEPFAGGQIADNIRNAA